MATYKLKIHVAERNFTQCCNVTSQLVVSYSWKADV